MSINPNNLSETATLTFSEEFNGNALDGAVWNTAYPWSAANGGSNTANQEEQWYINADYGPTAGLGTYVVRNGQLEINAQPTPQAYREHVNGYDYTSGMINTHGTFEQTYGYFEMRADIPGEQGMWPAFWLLNTNLSWPPEIDVMEVVGGSPDHLITSVHWDDNGHKMTNKSTHYPGLSDGMQVYGVDWQADTITWYLNGQQVHQVGTPADMHDPMYMLANLAVGGSWIGSPDGTTQFPATMAIDYIRAYSEMPADGSRGPGTLDPVIEEPVEKPVAEAPVQPPVEETPVDETPVAEIPVADETPIEEPVEDEDDGTPIAETPVEDVKDEIYDETPIAEAPVEDPLEIVAGPETDVPTEDLPVAALPEDVAGAPEADAGSGGRWERHFEKFAGRESGHPAFDALAAKFGARIEDAGAKSAGPHKAVDWFAASEKTDFSWKAGGKAVDKLFKGEGFAAGNGRAEQALERVDAFKQAWSKRADEAPELPEAWLVDGMTEQASLGTSYWDMA